MLCGNLFVHWMKAKNQFFVISTVSSSYASLQKCWDFCPVCWKFSMTVAMKMSFSDQKFQKLYLYTLLPAKSNNPVTANGDQMSHLTFSLSGMSTIIHHLWVPCNECVFFRSKIICCCLAWMFYVNDVGTDGFVKLPRWC